MFAFVFVFVFVFVFTFVFTELQRCIPSPFLWQSSFKHAVDGDVAPSELRYRGYYAQPLDTQVLSLKPTLVLTLVLILVLVTKNYHHLYVFETKVFFAQLSG